MQLIQRVQALVDTGASSYRDAAIPKEQLAAVLEIAYLAIAADRALRDEELQAFRGIAERLRARAGDDAAIGDRELDRVLDGFSAGLEHTSIDERARAVGARLTSAEARRLAYKLAYALSIVDLDASDAESDLDLALRDALGLSDDDAEQLAAEVDAALTAD
jgi:hypothetical protein